MITLRAIAGLSFSGIAAAVAISACVSDEPGAPDGDGGSSDASNQSSSDGGSDGNAASCTAPQTTCGTSCVNTSTDSANCGTCGHDCLGGMCSGGKCAAVAFFTGKGVDAATMGVGSVAVDSNAIYWSSPILPAPTFGGLGTQGQISTLPLDASAGIPRILYAEGEIDHVATVASVPGYVYWTDAVNDLVGRISGAGADSGSFPFATCASGANPCVVGGGGAMQRPYVLAGETAYMYSFSNDSNVANGNSGAVFKMLEDGGSLGSPIGLGSVPSGIPGAAIALDPDDGSHTWVFTLDLQGRVYGFQTGLTAQAPCLMGTSETSSSGGLVVAYHHVFWTDRGNGKVYSTPVRTDTTCLTPPSPTVIATTPAADPITADSAAIYWAAGGEIWTCPVVGCGTSGPTSVATQSSTIRSITNDAKAIYWGDEQGSVWRLAK